MTNFSFSGKIGAITENDLIFYVSCLSQVSHTAEYINRSYDRLKRLLSLTLDQFGK